MEGIVVGMDESSNAAQALRWAVGHGAAHSLPVTAVLAWGYIAQHHLEADQPFDPQYGEKDAQLALDQLVLRAVGPLAHVARREVCDLAPRALIEAAAGAQLLVVGARGVGGFQGLLLGSVSRQVLHHAPCPVAVVRAGDELPTTRRVVVGVDGSEPSRLALRWAIDDAGARAVPVVAVHAWRYPYVGVGFYGPVVDVDLLEKSAAELLDQELDRADTAGVTIERRVVPGPSAAAISAVADQLGDLIVVGSRGLGGFKGLLLGSVSDQLTLHASCPVVVVPSP